MSSGVLSTSLDASNPESHSYTNQLQSVDTSTGTTGSSIPSQPAGATAQKSAKSERQNMTSASQVTQYGSFDPAYVHIEHAGASSADQRSIAVGSSHTSSHAHRDCCVGADTISDSDGDISPGAGSLCKADDTGSNAEIPGPWYSPEKLIASFEAFVRPLVRDKIMTADNYDETCSLLNIGVPVFVCTVANSSVPIVNMSFLGHLGEEALAAVGLANVFMAFTGSSILWGMLTAFETFAAQAYGAGNLKRVGLLVQRSLVVSAAILMAVWTMCYYSEEILLICGFEAGNAYRSSRCIKILAFSIPCFTGFLTMEHYLACQSITWPPMVVTVCGAALSFPLNYLYIHILDWGYLGAPCATVTVNLCMVIALWAYVYRTGLHRPTWPGWTWECLNDLGPYLRFGVVGMGSVMTEWLTYELQAVLAGWGGTSALATQTLLMNILYFLFAFPLSMDTALNVRVGNELGANEPERAKRAAKVGGYMVICFQIVSLTLTATFWRQIGSVFTIESSVLAIMSKVLPLFVFSVFFDGIQGAMAGAIQGAGYPKFSLAVNIVAYWITALPMAYYLSNCFGTSPDFRARLEIIKDGVWAGRAYTKQEIHTLSTSSNWDALSALLPTVEGLGIYGQWIAICLGPVIAASSFVAFLYFLDWPAVAKFVSDREAQEARELEAQKLLESGSVEAKTLAERLEAQGEVNPTLVALSPATVSRAPHASQNIHYLALSPRANMPVSEALGLSPRHTMHEQSLHANLETVPLLGAQTHI